MSRKVRHVLGISGGKDSAALAIYMKSKYPTLDIEYYTCDTGKELDETYQLIENLEIYLGKKINKLKATGDSPELPFDHFLKMYGGFLPSSNARWCTKKLKLDPFEKYVGDDLVISYVGIRGDEDREGYISTKTNIQSIFPFRKNIWSEDVLKLMFTNENIELLAGLHSTVAASGKSDRFREILNTPLSYTFHRDIKVRQLLDFDVLQFNALVLAFLGTTNYPLATEAAFPLIDNDDILVRDDIFRILNESGVGVPEYYKKVVFSVNGKNGSYSRSRSGCFFCFFQQKIEWIWLYEQHPELFRKAMAYEREGYTWMQDEKLEDLLVPERMDKIKEDFINKTNKSANTPSAYLLDILDEEEGIGCAACFI